MGWGSDSFFGGPVSTGIWFAADVGAASARLNINALRQARNSKRGGALGRGCAL